MIKKFNEFNESKKQDRYSLVKVGGFRVGDYSSISAAKKVMKGEEKGNYQIINNQTGIAVWEGENK